LRYTAAFKAYNSAVSTDKVRIALNGILPPDIRVLACREVDENFHAQFSATGREYVYLAASADTPLPQFRNYVHFVMPDRFPQDIAGLRECARLFTGEKDFAQFCYGYTSDEDIGTVRKVDYFRVASWSALGMKGVVFTIRANGFLRGMIRTLVSVCLNYAAGKLTRDEILRSIAGEPVIPPYRKAAAPACGLYFKRAYYPKTDSSES
jgi:tRNA pseudouridine38-40 synthase